MINSKHICSLQRLHDRLAGEAMAFRHMRKSIEAQGLTDDNKPEYDDLWLDLVDRLDQMDAVKDALELVRQALEVLA